MNEEMDEEEQKAEQKAQVSWYEEKINNIPLTIDPCRMCENHDTIKGFGKKCLECCWYYHSRFEIKKEASK